MPACEVVACERRSEAHRLCHKHYLAALRSGTLPPRPTAADRFWRRVGKTETCWLWTASLTAGGYGRFTNVAGGRRNVMAHRWAYESEVGPIPIGLTLDHLCKVRRCVRPDHLEAVTLQENLLRGLTFQASNAAKTRCPRGHPYTAQNTRHHCGSRHCKTCEWLARRGLKWAADIDHAEAYNLAMRAVTRRGRA